MPDIDLGKGDKEVDQMDKFQEHEGLWSQEEAGLEPKRTRAPEGIQI